MNYSGHTLEQLKSEMKTIVDAAKSNTITQAQSDAFDGLKAALEAANAREKAIAEGEAIVKAMAGQNDDWTPEFGNYTPAHDGTGIKSFTMTRASFQKSAEQLARRSRSDARAKGVTTILPGVSFDGPILSSGIIELGRDTNSALELLVTEAIKGRHYSYARQSSRTNNAAIVRPGEVKPTSSYGVEMVAGETQVIAHLSDPIDEFLLRDVDGLETVVAREMTYGLWDTLDDQIINGTGDKVAPAASQFTGILSTSGIQTQAFVNDALTTIRTGFTKLRQVGRTPQAVVLNPTDWQTLELMRATDGGEFLLGSNGPIDAAKRTLWGVQVVESFAVPVGTAIIMQRDAAKVIVSEPGTILTWHVSGDGFETNTIRLRVEMRADLAVKMPDAIVKATISEG